MATEGLLVYPHFNDQMIAGIPPVTLPTIQDRDASLWGPSGADFIPDWEPSAPRAASAAASDGVYAVRAAAQYHSDRRYLH